MLTNYTVILIYTLALAFDLIIDILSYKPDIKIIGVTLVYDEKIAKELQQLGVTGYIYRSVGSIDRIVDCFERIYTGEHYFIE